MASGMDMMLEKMLGVNPKQIQEQAQDMALKMGAVVKSLQDQLGRIETNQQVMYQLMVKAGLIDPVTVLENEPMKDNAPLIGEDNGRIN